MSTGKPQVPAVEGWFTTGDAPALLGSKCRKCGSFFFPKESFFCRNPHCSGDEFDEVPLSRTGKIWSYTTNHYQPPAPYESPEPFVPYTVAAVELDAEKMVVLGQVASGVDPDTLTTGTEMELVLESLFEDDDNDYLVYKWKPVEADAQGANR